jgi:hypothetical protein
VGLSLLSVYALGVDVWLRFLFLRVSAMLRVGSLGWMYRGGVGVGGCVLSCSAALCTCLRAVVVYRTHPHRRAAADFLSMDRDNLGPPRPRPRAHAVSHHPTLHAASEQRTARATESNQTHKLLVGNDASTTS